MAKKDFIPRKDSELLLWHDNFLAVATPQAAGLGLTPADIATINTDNENLHSSISGHFSAALAAENATVTKDAHVKTAVGNARRFARRMKTGAAYSEGLGDSLGIIGEEDTTDLVNAQPTLKGRPQGGGVVEISFNKSTSDGVNIYSQREGEALFTFLARDTESPYVDNRPLLVATKPELRQYRAKYVLGDHEVGNYSDEMVVGCAP